LEEIKKRGLKAWFYSRKMILVLSFGTLTRPWAIKARFP
jgi:hypothetical protein